MLIDLHCHTSGLSPCSSLEPERLVALARERGLDALCLTEHDRLWDEAEIRALSCRLRFPLLRGMEVTTELGHVLVFGLDYFEPGLYIAARLRERVTAAGGLMALAHPGRAGQPAVAPETAAELFDLVEALNGSDGPAQNRAGAQLAAAAALPGIGGSDCHAPHEVATAATRLERPIADEAGLVFELRRGCHQFVDLRGCVGAAMARGET